MMAVQQTMQTEFWDRRSDTYDAAVSQHDAMYDKTIGATESLLSTSDIVLDFACASGEMSLDIASHVEHVHGVDSSARMIELARHKARDRNAPNVSFAHADAFDPSLKPESFDAVIAFNILHLLEAPTQVLERLRALLVPGGLLISQTPCLGQRGWLMRSVLGLAQGLRVAPPVLNLKAADVRSLIAHSGFEVLDYRVWDSKNAVQWIVARRS